MTRPILAVRDVVTSDTHASPSQPITTAASVSTPPRALPARARPAHARAATAEDDPLRRETVLIVAARRALDRGAYANALASLDTHATEFPHGLLARERERMRRRIVAAMR